MIQSWKDELVSVQAQDPKLVPWWIAWLAYKDYKERYNNLQSLHTILQRGGFGQNELIDHLAHLARKLTEENERTEAKLNMAYEAAQGAERERCAQIVDSYEHTCSCHIAEDIAALIRSKALK